MLSDAYQYLWREMMHLNFRGWMVVFAVAVALGALCLRGFGSRSNY